MSYSRNLARLARSGAPVVASAQALRDLVIYGGLYPPSAITEGSLEAGDGGGGTWLWDTYSTADDNTGTALLPTGHAGAGRWLRHIDGAYNARWFGFLPYVSPTNNAAALQAAVDAVEDLGGGSVYVPAGHYEVNSPTVVMNHVEIYGDGPGTHIENSVASPTWPYGQVFMFGTYWGYGSVASFWNEAGSTFAPAAAGAYSLTLDDVTGFDVGDIVAMRCDHANNDRFSGSPRDPLDHGYGYYSPAWMTEITGISGSVVTLAHPLPVPMITIGETKPKIYRETGALVYAAFGNYQCRLAKNCVLRDMQISTAVNSLVAVHFSAYQCQFSNLFISSGSITGNPIAHSLFADNVLDSAYASLELAYLHVGCTLRNNRITMRDTVSFTTFNPGISLGEGGGHCVLTGNIIATPPHATGSASVGAINIGSGDYGTICTGNKIIGGKAYGIAVVGDNSIIADNAIEGTNLAAITTVSSSGNVIANNRIDNCCLDRGQTAACAIWIYGTDSGLTIPNNNLVHGNVITGAEARIVAPYGINYIYDNVYDRSGDWADLRKEFSVLNVSAIQHTGSVTADVVYSATIPAILVPSGVGAYYALRCIVRGNNSIAYAASAKSIGVYFSGSLVFSQAWGAGTYGPIDIDLTLIWDGGSVIAVVSQVTNSGGSRIGEFSAITVDALPYGRDLGLVVSAQINNAEHYIRLDQFKVSFE